jgi:ketosteroid isomerase-like protein
MSQENVEVVRSVYGAWNRGDQETALGFAHPEIVIDASRRVFNPTTYVAKEGARRLFADTDEVWEQFHTELDELTDTADRVVVTGRLIGKGRASGVEVEQPIADVWTVRDGRIIRGELNFTGRREALEAAGLSE